MVSVRQVRKDISSRKEIQLFRKYFLKTELYFYELEVGFSFKK